MWLTVSYLCLSNHQLVLIHNFYTDDKVDLKKFITKHILRCMPPQEIMANMWKKCHLVWSDAFFYRYYFGMLRLCMHVTAEYLCNFRTFNKVLKFCLSQNKAVGSPIISIILSLVLKNWRKKISVYFDEKHTVFITT